MSDDKIVQMPAAPVAPPEPIRITNIYVAMVCKRINEERMRIKAALNVQNEKIATALELLAAENGLSDGFFNIVDPDNGVFEFTPKTAEVK